LTIPEKKEKKTIRKGKKRWTKYCRGEGGKKKKKKPGLRGISGREGGKRKKGGCRKKRKENSRPRPFA